MQPRCALDATGGCRPIVDPLQLHGTDRDDEMTESNIDTHLRGAEAEREPPLLLDARDAAGYLSVSLRTLYALRAKGDLAPPVRLTERVVRYRRADLASYVEHLAAAAIPEPSQLSAGKARKAARQSVQKVITVPHATA